jgi:hypothetical protein
VHHRDSEEEYDDEYDEEIAKGGRRQQPHDESMLMGLGLMGVVATQHIREEYDDEDDDDEYGTEQVQEGGGNENYDQIVYHTNEP